jgi:benzoate membrane transport protein
VGPALTAALSMVMIMTGVLGVVLGAASTQGLTTGETAAWIITIYGVAGGLGLLLTVRYRQPLPLTGNVFIVIFVAGLGTDFSWPELVGAAMAAGAVVLVLGALGLTGRLTALLPAPIVYGLLAGAVLPFFVDMFTELGSQPLLVGGMLVAYLLAQWKLAPRVPAILLALLVGLLLAGLGGDLRATPAAGVLTAPTFTLPDFSWSAIITVTPILVVLITVQANAPSVVILRSQGYRPPERVVTVVSGAGTLGSSLLGPTGVSLALPLTALAAGPGAGPRAVRHWSVYVAAGYAIVVALLAGLAAQLATVLPGSLLVAVVGLAVVAVLSHALREAVLGPLVWGPLFALAISLSELSLLGLGPFFWAIAGGVTASLLLERTGWRRPQSGQADGGGGS